MYYADSKQIGVIRMKILWSNKVDEFEVRKHLRNNWFGRFATPVFSFGCIFWVKQLLIMISIHFGVEHSISTGFVLEKNMWVGGLTKRDVLNVGSGWFFSVEIFSGSLKGWPFNNVKSSKLEPHWPRSLIHANRMLAIGKRHFQTAILSSKTCCFHELPLQQQIMTFYNQVEHLIMRMFPSVYVKLSKDPATSH